MTKKGMVLLAVALLGAMATVGVALGWRVMQRAPGVDGTDAPLAFAVHDDVIYALRGSDGELELVRAPLEGGWEVLWRGRGTDRGFVAAGSEGVLFSVCTQEAPGGCVANTFLAAPDGTLRQLPLTQVVTSAAFLRGTIFLTVASSVRKLDVATGELETVSYSTACTQMPAHLVADGDAVYWTDIATIWSLEAEGEPRELRDGVAFVARLAVAGGELFALEARSRKGDPLSGRVVKIATTRTAVGPAGGATAPPATTVVDGLRDPTDLVVNERAIVVTAEEPDENGITHRAIFVAPRAGGVAERLVSLPPRGGAIASDGQRVFVAGPRVAVLDLP